MSLNSWIWTHTFEIQPALLSFLFVTLNWLNLPYHGKSFSSQYSLQYVSKRVEIVLITSWRHLEDVLKTSLQNVIYDIFETVLKTSWIRLGMTSWKCIEENFNMSSIHLQNALKAYSENNFIYRLDQNVLKTSSEEVWPQ